MTLWQRWVQRPQTLGLRKAFFQIHLWVGIAIGLYVLVISVSGSAVVFRRELMSKYARPAPTIAISGVRMSEAELKNTAQSRYPDYTVDAVEMSRRADRAATIVLKRGDDTVSRLFNPYNGDDLGDPESTMERFIYWMVDFHDNLLGAQTGRLVNGVFSILVTLLTLSGMVVWWPGSKTWRRSIGLNWEGSFVRFNWDLHSVLGFWCSLFAFMWGISGIYLCFPQLFTGFSDKTQAWLARIHFGRMNLYTKTFWMILGLIPAILFITGTLMWWYRVLSPFLRRKFVRVPHGTVNEGISND
jgi:uncharacterized iron-regulated membrane protein